MTAITLDLGFSNRPNNSWLRSTVASFAFEEFPEIQIEESRWIGLAYGPGTKKIFSAATIPTSGDNSFAESSGEIIVDVPLVDRSKEKLLLGRQILGFLDLDGLDDDEATELLSAAVPEALVFIEELPSDIPLPDATIGLDGIITLEWVDGSKKAAAMFEGDDSYGYAYFKNGRYVPGTETGIAGNGMPDDLKGYLTA
ncbi:hypothetical protein [Burkholderia sp. BCC1630]|uniref:hypothetical protein n=1 Tax=Burkholderia sp. BCC1630 TaxID=2676304 RepID=UPI00158E8FC2|nr:hypothetical protein [Burkholderia sp. BCC1630]